MLSWSFLADLFYSVVKNQCTCARWRYFQLSANQDKLDKKAAASLFFSFEVDLNAVLFNLLLSLPPPPLPMFFFGSLCLSCVFFYRLKQLFRTLCQFCDRFGRCWIAWPSQFLKNWSLFRWTFQFAPNLRSWAPILAASIHFLLRSRAKIMGWSQVSLPQEVSITMVF